ncbi:lipase family protein [Aspergillus tanneri]|uniref:Fungal lipase-type domain-containing protein n=1 Tax=Aspergillus tanneri TaxID=1220188 RepID=A0A5M9MAB4_9EURO|nr:uncharacterized protein ATNIH1004_008178 [Aspergillus tanneri]KAA8643982.1 hypothetical protein ATNIH1004_008178 [Aspergillus tanneri]
MPAYHIDMILYYVFKEIIRYTKFAAAAYVDYCATPPYGSSVVQYFNDEYTDTQATLFRDDLAKELIIAFRGSSSPTDLDTDVDFNLVPVTAGGISCADCLVHRGFQVAYESISNDVASTIQSTLSSTSGYSITVTGHSLGAALAAIAAPALINKGIRVAKTFTFGEPRNGNAAWASYVSSVVPDSNYYRVTHANDGVPHIPPDILGFQHHGPEYWESKSDASNTATTVYYCGNNSTL